MLETKIFRGVIKTDIQNQNIINNLIITNRNQMLIKIINNRTYHQEILIILI